jgi:stress-induced morphogen
MVYSLFCLTSFPSDWYWGGYTCCYKIAFFWVSCFSHDQLSRCHSLVPKPILPNPKRNTSKHADTDTQTNTKPKPNTHTHSPKDSETHFKVVVVTSQFDSIKSPIQRHRLIHSALEEELKGPVHALSIVAKSPSQWDTMMTAGQTVPASPACRGGDGSLPSKKQ